MKGTLRTVVCVLLLFVIAWLVWANVRSIMEPVNFDKAKNYRESVAIQRLKDLRTLQEAYKSANGRFTANADSLINFYKNGKMDVIMQIGSNDDSLAVANTEALRKKNRKITPEEMYALYQQGQHLVFSIKNEIAVKDTLFNNRPDFCVDSIATIPFSGGEAVQMQAIVKQVSGVNVPLFEAKIPYKSLLKGLDNQLRINLDDERIKSKRYEGLQVGSISAPNNNAGNWE